MVFCGLTAKVELPFENEPDEAILTMLDAPVSSASSQLAELAGPFAKALCDDAPGTEPLQTGAAEATPATPSELTANPAATITALPNETILTMIFPRFRTH